MTNMRAFINQHVTNSYLCNMSWKKFHPHEHEIISPLMTKFIMKKIMDNRSPTAIPRTKKIAFQIYLQIFGNQHIK